MFNIVVKIESFNYTNRTWFAFKINRLLRREKCQTIAQKSNVIYEFCVDVASSNFYVCIRGIFALYTNPKCSQPVRFSFETKSSYQTLNLFSKCEISFIFVERFRTIFGLNNIMGTIYSLIFLFIQPWIVHAILTQSICYDEPSFCFPPNDFHQIQFVVKKMRISSALIRSSSSRCAAATPLSQLCRVNERWS